MKPYKKFFKEIGPLQGPQIGAGTKLKDNFDKINYIDQFAMNHSRSKLYNYIEDELDKAEVSTWNKYIKATGYSSAPPRGSRSGCRSVPVPDRTARPCRRCGSGRETPCPW